MTEKTIRAFIAMELPLQVKESLVQTSRILMAQLPPNSVRWAKPEQMHLTLRFLGNIAASHIPLLSDAIDKLTTSYAPFALQFDQLGCFPNCEQPRVIWLGLQAEKEALQTLKNNLDIELQTIGLALETRPFCAHLTLGRVKYDQQLPTLNWLEKNVQVNQMKWQATIIDLIESQLGSNGAVYTTRHRSLLLG